METTVNPGETTPVRAVAWAGRRQHSGSMLAVPRVTRSSLLRASTGTLAAGVLAACSPGASEGKPGQNKEPVTVVYYNDLIATHPETIARIANWTEFNSTVGKELGIVMDLSNAAAGAGGNQQGGTDNTKIKSMVSAGTSPDMYFTAWYDAAEYFTAGMTIDVDTELKNVKGWAAQKADLFPAYADSSSWAGKLVSMPGYTDTRGFIWNKGLLQQAGIADPQWGWTWNDFREKASKFVGRDGIIPLSMAWVNWIGQFLATTGVHEISDDRKTIQFDTPQMLQVFELFLDLLQRKIVFPHPDPANRNGLGETYRNANNDTVFEQQGVYRLGTFRTNKVPDFGVMHTPVDPAKKAISTSNGGESMLVFKDIKPEKRAASARAAMWANSTYAQTQMVIKGTALPVSKAVMNEPRLNDFLKTDPQLAGFVRLAPYGWRFPTLPSRAAINTVLTTTLQKVMYQEIGPKPGLQLAQRDAQALLDKDVATMK